MFKHARVLAPLLVAALLGACDDEAVNPPTAAAGAMFARYIALGNSITAGFQSGGIDSTTQNQSYAVLLANSMGTTFIIPKLAGQGCPPLFSNIFTQERTSAVPCAVRTDEIPEFINLVAIPGAAVIDVFSNFDPASGPNTLTTVLGGGHTQLQNAAMVRPTFVTVWIGNNDALGAVLTVGNAGDPSLVTDPGTFATRYTAMMDSLDALGSIQGGVLIGVVQVALAPYLTQGRVWKGFELGFDAQVQAQFDAAFAATVAGLVAAGILPPIPTVENATLTTLGINANFFDVDLNCLANQPLTATDTAWASVPFHMGGPILSAASAGAADPTAGANLITFGVDSLVRILNPAAPAPNVAMLPTPTVMDCSVADAVTATEATNLFASVSAFNATIEAEADERGWVYIDPNDLLRQLAQDTSAIRPFPAFPGTASNDATLNTPFGSALSLDGIHPSASVHRSLASVLIVAINAAYSSSIPALQ